MELHFCLALPVGTRDVVNRRVGSKANLPYALSTVGLGEVFATQAHKYFMCDCLDFDPDKNRLYTTHSACATIVNESLMIFMLRRRHRPLKHWYRSRYG